MALPRTPRTIDGAGYTVPLSVFPLSPDPFGRPLTLGPSTSLLRRALRRAGFTQFDLMLVGSAPNARIDIFGPAATRPPSLPANILRAGPVDYADPPRTVVQCRVGLIPLSDEETNGRAQPDENCTNIWPVLELSAIRLPPTIGTMGRLADTVGPAESVSEWAAVALRDRGGHGGMKNSSLGFARAKGSRRCGTSGLRSAGQLRGGIRAVGPTASGRRHGAVRPVPETSSRQELLRVVKGVRYVTRVGDCAGERIVFVSLQQGGPIPSGCHLRD
jgi:hypothetical protein